MIKKTNVITGIGGGNPSLMPVIQTDFRFACGDTDGVFYQETDGEKALVLSLRGVTATICRLTKNVDVEELLSFLEFRQVSNILSDFFFDGYGLEKRSVLKVNTRVEAFENTTIITSASRLSDYKNIFNLLSPNGEFDVWYPSFSRKVNNFSACGVYMSENSSAVSCAVAPFIYGDVGIIAGVYTDECYRKKGYGTKCVQALVSDLKSKNIETAYLWCEDKNIKFYENIGFTLCGEIYVKKEE